MGTIVDLKAMQKWNEISKEHQQLIIDNAYCNECFTTTIVDFEIADDKYGVVLEGKCQKCGKDIARLVEID